MPRLPSPRGNSLVGANASSFQGFGAQLFVLVGNKVDAEREFVDICLLSAEIEDANLGVRYTTVETRLWVGLVLYVSFVSVTGLRIASSRGCSGSREIHRVGGGVLGVAKWEFIPCSCSNGSISQDGAPS